MITWEIIFLEMTERMDPQTFNLQVTLEKQDNIWADSICKYILNKRE